MKELWSDIPGFDGRYQASTLGRIKSIHPTRGNIILKYKVNYGYRRVTLYKKGKAISCLVHRLVAFAFLGERGDEIVLHRDGVKDNVYLSNLHYGTYSQNNGSDKRDHGTQYCGTKHHYAKHNQGTVDSMVILHKAGLSYSAIAKQLNIPKSTVHYTVNNRIG